ncbi:MAG TPA: hypothetical protein VE641_13395, partial [Chthoniobacterales bacterium]|nr:hypothetical protein [Chthoniobacterales bacterium]
LWTSHSLPALPTPSLDDAVAFHYGQTSVSIRWGLSPHCCAYSQAHRFGSSGAGDWLRAN